LNVTVMALFRFAVLPILFSSKAFAARPLPHFKGAHFPSTKSNDGPSQLLP
jgi:hypothetical protein